MWDRLVFSNIRKLFGGRIRLILTAGAPISGELLQFTRAVFCCPVSKNQPNNFEKLTYNQTKILAWSLKFI